MQLLLEAQASDRRSSRVNDLVDVSDLSRVIVEKKLTEEVWIIIKQMLPNYQLIFNLF